jgi:hypothetical protein
LVYVEIISPVFNFYSCHSVVIQKIWL